MATRATLAEQVLGADDIARVVSALLEGIRRGELLATRREVEFLASVERLLAPAEVALA